MTLETGSEIVTYNPDVNGTDILFYAVNNTQIGVYTFYIQATRGLEHAYQQI